MTAKKEEKTVKDKILAMRNVDEIGSFFSKLEEVLAYLNLSEQGRLTASSGEDIVRCISIERFEKDDRFGKVTFDIQGYKVLMTFGNNQAVPIANILSSRNVELDIFGLHSVILHDGTVVTKDELIKLSQWALANWRPRNYNYWTNMARVWDFQHLHHQQPRKE